MSLSAHTFEPPNVELPKQMQFALLDAGKQPHEALRYGQRAPDTSYLADTKLTSRRLAGGSWGAPAPLVAVRNGLALSLAPAQGPVQLRPLPAEVLGKPTPETAGYLESWRALEGRRFAVAVDDRGQLGAITFADDPQNARSAQAISEMTQRLLATLVPVPEEPVGVGASWRVIWALEQRPAVVRQTATYTLLARTQDSWKIGIEVRRAADAQTILDPSIPEGTAVQLVAWLRTFEGTVTVKPDQLLPSGTLAVTSSMHLRILRKGAGETEEIAEDSGEVVLSVSPRR